MHLNPNIVRSRVLTNQVAIAIVIALSMLVSVPAMAVPVNNNAANATQVHLGINIVDNRGATNGLPPSCADQADVWYYFDANAAQCSAVVFDLSVDLITPSSGYTPAIAVYDGQGVNEIACDDTAPYSITFPATPTVYLIRVAGVSGAQGTARLIINCSGPNTIPGYVWERVSTTGPAPRYDHSMVYDPNNQKVLLFGGRSPTAGYFDDLWEWDSTARTWTNVTPAGPRPSARYGHAMAFDSYRNRLVLFGGVTGSGLSNETWEYDPTVGTWSLIATPSAPSARYDHGISYDALRNKIVLFGGNTGGAPNGETWEYDGLTSQWQFKQTTACPGSLICPRFNFAMATSQTVGVTTVFGGTDGFNCYNDTFGWNGTSWGISTQPGPTSRFSDEMIWDSTTHKYVLYGGTTINCTPGGGAQSDTVTYGSTWAYQNAVGNPARFGHAMAFDDSIGAIVLHGGASNTTLYGDTYIGERGIPNDDVDGAISIVSGSSRTIDSQAATDGPSGCASGADLWYKYTADCTGLATISVTGTTFLSELAIYQGYPPAGSPIVCESSTTGNVVADFAVTNGVTYTVRVGAVGGAGGVGTLNVLPCNAQSCPPIFTVYSQTQFLVNIVGNASGIPWSWTIEWPGGFASDYHVPGVPPGGTAADLAAAWVASINSHSCANNRLRALQLPAPNDNKFKIVIGGNQPYMNVAVGPAGQIPTCYLNPVTLCPFNPDAWQIALSGVDCNANGEDDTIDLLLDPTLDGNNNGLIDSCEVTPGDVNCDGHQDGSDIGAFVQALTDPTAYADSHPDCPIQSADLTGDGLVTTEDIDAFLSVILEGD